MVRIVRMTQRGVKTAQPPDPPSEIKLYIMKDVAGQRKYCSVKTTLTELFREAIILLLTGNVGKHEWWYLARGADQSFDRRPERLRGARIVHFSLTILISVTMGWKISACFMTQQIGSAVSHSVEPSCRESNLFCLAEVRCLNDNSTETVEWLSIRKHIKILDNTMVWSISAPGGALLNKTHTAGIRWLEASPWITSSVIFSCFMLLNWMVSSTPRLKVLARVSHLDLWGSCGTKAYPRSPLTEHENQV